MLIEHGIDHMNKGFIGRKEAVTSREQVAFEHPFYGVLAEHFDDAPVSSQFATISVFGKIFRDPELLAYFIDVLQLVGCIFVRTEDPEAIHVRFHDIPQESS